MAPVTELVGRSTERELLSTVLSAAASGEPGVVVLHGEPGVGKTRLVTEAVTSKEGGTRHVLWARCLRFGTDGAAFLPVAQAVSTWLKGPVSPETRASVLEGAGELAALLPRLGGAAGAVPGGRLLTLLALVIHRIAEDAPAVLVVDDLQWADPSTLDLLAYLIAGFGREQRLAILGTYRDTELEPGHVLHAWVADMRRMPRVVVQSLGGLGRLETEALVRLRNAGRATVVDVDDVYERSKGNPYLTELILADADDVAGGSLSEALLAAWHRLGPSARRTTQVLAVGGRPVPTVVLAAVVKRTSGTDREVGSDVLEARAAGVVVAEGESVWFRHPLLAEVVGATVDPLTSTAIHTAYVESLEATDGVSDLAKHGLMALHHEAAGRATEAFVSSLRAADAAARVFATGEESQHLERACRLWAAVDPTVREAVGDHAALLERASVTADMAGRFDVGEALAQAAIAAVDGEAEPLRLSRLLVSLPLNIDLPDDRPDSKLRRALRSCDLARPHGATDELALAMAMLAMSKIWMDEPDAEQVSIDAVALAERVGSPTTQGFAHLVHAQFQWSTLDGLAEAEAGWEILRAHGSVRAWGFRAQAYLNCIEGVGLVERLAAEGARVLTDATRSGAPVVGAAAGVRAALQLIHLGRFDQAGDLLRRVHAHRQTRYNTAEARATEMVLAVRTGEMSVAKEHAQRVEELWSGRPVAGTHILDAQLEWAWARGDWESVLGRVRQLIPSVWRVDPDMAEDWLTLAARSAADLAESGGSSTVRRHAQGLYAEIEALRPSTGLATTENGLRSMTRAGLDSERARLHETQDQVERWRVAADAARTVGYPWHEAWAAYQRGRALLRGHGRRADAAAALRDAHRLAQGIGARPLAERVAALALQSRIPLGAEPSGKADVASPRTLLGGVALTGREAEVLGHVVAGRTYGEIARSLFISEKTVSVHVSNLLRKTGASSRVELAELAARESSTR